MFTTSMDFGLGDDMNSQRLMNASL